VTRAVDSVAKLPVGRIPRGLRAKLLAAVRPEFRVDVFYVYPGDPVLGGPACIVEQCQRVARRRGLCSGHTQRWLIEGRADVAVFASTTDPTIFGHRQPGPCLVNGCGYSQHSGRLCEGHLYWWRKSNGAEVQLWARTAAPPATVGPHPLCRVQSCPRWAEPRSQLCGRHAANWRANGRPDIEEFSQKNSVSVQEHIDLRPLEPHLRLEMQYVLQQRHDDAANLARLRPSYLQHLFGILANSGMPSLMAWPDDEWSSFVDASASVKPTRPLLIHAREQVETLQHGTGWEVEYPRSVWRLRNVGAEVPGISTISFTPVPQPWLADLVKRWIRLRLSSGLHPGTCVKGVTAVTFLGKFLAKSRPAVDALSKVNRLVLEEFLADLHSSGMTATYRTGVISSIGIFLGDLRRHRWDATLPADAVFYPEDSPKLPKPVPRALAEFVMAQVEKPDNLNLFANPTYELITLILIRCGLRITDATGLPFDCVVTDTEAAPYLRYYNHKMRREALVPIDEELHRLIRDQQRRLLQHWPQGVPVLFPRPSTNRDGSKPICGGTYRPALKAWLQRCDIRDELGQPVHLTPHQWRHTLGTRLINRDVPQEVVRRILDHESLQMTARYARLHDTTVRRHWEQARKVNITGDTVILDPDGPLADAAWTKQRLSRATQALPNGYCGLPLAKSCPHANACLACPMFLTTAEFLPEHRQQRQATLQIITRAEAEGHTRLAEMNRQVADNLAKIIDALEADDDGQVAHAS
jgi:integrase